MKLRVDQFMAEKALSARASQSEGQRHVNAERTNILTSARAKAALPPGLFSLTVPTGGGKTLASLTFAFDHAIKHGLDRVIYVIPFTGVIEQTAAVFRDALGPELAGHVIEHHSAFREEEALKAMSRDDESSLQAGERMRFGNRELGCADRRHHLGAVLRESVLEPAEPVPEAAQHRAQRRHSGRSTNVAADVVAALWFIQAQLLARHLRGDLDAYPPFIWK